MGECDIPKEGYQQQPAYKLNRVTSIFIGTPLCIIGIILNIICVMLWYRLMKHTKKRNTSCGVYLIVISIVDIGAVTTFLFCDILVYLRPELIHSHLYNVIYAYVGHPALIAFTFASYWLIAGVDSCRLTMVLFPIKFRQSSMRMTNTAIVLIILFVIGVNFPNFFAYRASHTADGVPCRYKTTLFMSDSFTNYVFWFQCVFMTALPWVIIVIVNIIMQIVKFCSHSYTIPPAKRTAAEMGKLLCAISVWFVTIVFVQCLTRCFYLQTTKGNKHWDKVDSITAFTKLGLVFNSSCKPFLVYLTSRTFRKEVVRTFCNTKSLYSTVTRFPNNKQFNRNRNECCLTSKNKTRRGWFGNSVNSIADSPSPNCLVKEKYIAPLFGVSSVARENNILFSATRDVAKIELHL